jgi:hypothetical protein
MQRFYVMVGRQVGKELVAENANVVHKRISFGRAQTKQLIASLALPAIEGDKSYVVYHKLRK